MLAGSLPYRCALLLLLATTARAQLSSRAHKPAQAQAAEASDPNTVVLAPAHPDPGQTGSGQEREITLSLATKLHDLLTPHAFRVVVVLADNESHQIELLNRSRASACLLLHAANGGHGVHLYTSSLSAAPPTRSDSQRTVIPWDTTQAAALPQSIELAGDLATALNGIRVPLVSGRASVAPIDSINCPAVAIELAPYTPDHDATLQPSDAGYQQRVAEAVVTALLFRRQKIEAAAAGAHTEPER